MVEVFLAPKPMISTASPTLTLPRSIRPVPTVPRPLIENTSSIGIRNGLSISRTGSGMYSSSALTRSSIGLAALASLGVVEGRPALPRMIGISSPGNSYLVSSSRSSSSTSSSSSASSTRSILLRKTTMAGHADLAGQQDVLAGLRHRAVGGGDHQDRAVHLGGAGDHVLDVVGVAGAVDVGVVPLRGLVLDVRDGDRHRLGRVADGAALGDVGVRLGLGPAVLGQDGQDGGRQRRLAVVDVPDGAHVDVRLGSGESFLGHVLRSALLAFCCAQRLSASLTTPAGNAPSCPTRLTCCAQRLSASLTFVTIPTEWPLPAIRSRNRHPDAHRPEWWRRKP